MEDRDSVGANEEESDVASKGEEEMWSPNPRGKGEGPRSGLRPRPSVCTPLERVRSRSDLVALALSGEILWASRCDSSSASKLRCEGEY